MLIFKGYTVKPVLSGHSDSKRSPKIFFQYRLPLNACQKYCRMLRGEHSAILSTCIKVPFSIKTLILSIFKWPLKTGFTVDQVHDCFSFCRIINVVFLLFYRQQCIEVHTNGLHHTDRVKSSQESEWPIKRWTPGHVIF